MANLSCIYTLSDKINLHQLSEECNLPKGVELSSDQVISSLYKIAAKRGFPAAEYEEHLDEVYNDLISDLYMHDTVYIENNEDRETYNENAEKLRFNLRLGSVLDYLRKLQVIHKFNGYYYVSKTANSVTTIQQAQALISKALRQVGLPENTLKVYTLPGGSFTVNLSNNEDLKRYDEFTSESEKQVINSIIGFLQERFPALKDKVHYISVKEAKSLLKDHPKVDINDVNSFVKEGEVYLIEGRVTRDSAVEECLHPFVKALEISNKKLFDNLYSSAIDLIPSLRGKVEVTYTDDKGFSFSDRQNEVITKALVQYFSGEYDKIENSKDGRKSFLDYVAEFLNWFRKLFAPINPRTQNHVIEIEDLNTHATLSDLADLLNLKDVEIQGIDRSKTYFNIQEVETFIKGSNKAVCVSADQAKKLSDKGFTVYEIKNKGLYIVNIPEGIANIELVEVKDQEKTLEDHIRTVEDAIKILSTKVSKGENFEQEHKYNIIIPGKSESIQNTFSVTEVASRLSESEYGNKKDDKGNLITAVGNSFDTIVRNFFLGKKSWSINSTLAGRNIKEIEEALSTKFIPFLDKQFGKDKYKVITSEMLLAGKYGKDEKGNDQYIAGATDMLIVTATGDIWIVDMKTTGKDTGLFNRNKDRADKTKKKYGYQLLLYKELLKENFPQLADKVKGTVLLVGTRTGIPESVLYKDGKYYDEETNKLASPKVEINFDSNAIKKEKNWISVGEGLSLETPVENINLGIDEIVSDAYIDNLIKQYDKQKEEKRKQISSAIINTPSPEGSAIIADDSVIVPPSERTYLGRQLMILISNTCDDISSGKPYIKSRYPELANLEGKTASEILRTSNAFDIILEKEINSLFNPLFYSKDPIMENKVKWVRENKKILINEAISELINIEHVTIGGSNSIAVDGETENLLDLYSIAEMEESFREGYYIESREVGFESLVPKELKRRLSKIADPNSGKKKLSIGAEVVHNKYGYLGIPDFLDKHYVLDTLTDNLYMCHSYSAMVDKLNTLKTKSGYEWMQEVLDMLQDDLELQSLFARTFWKDKVIYTSIYDSYDKDGNVLYNFRILNAQEGRGSLKQNWEDAKYSSGIFRIETTTEKGGDKLIVEEEWKNKFKDKKADSYKRALKTLKALAFDYVDIKKAAKDTVVQKALSDIILLGDRTVSKVDQKVPALIEALLPYYNNASEQMVYDNGKTYSTYVEPSELGTILSDLSNLDSGLYDNEGFKEDSIYKNYIYYKIGDTWVNGWLEMLDNPQTKYRNLIGNVYANTSTLDSNFNEQDRRKYLINMLCSYAAPSTGTIAKELGLTNADPRLALFRVPTMSDKNAEDSILFYKPIYSNTMTSKDLHEKGAEYAFNYFLYEIKRMESIVDAYREGRKDDLVDIWKPKGVEINKEDITVDLFLDEKGNIKKELLESGLVFRYLYSLNDHIFSKDENLNTDAKAIREYVLTRINGEKPSDEAEANLRSSFDNIFIADMNSRYEEFKKLAYQLVGKEGIERILGKAENLEEFYWNDTIATMNILNLTIQDPAYFKNVIDFQKRFAQMHASAAKPNVEAEFITNEGSKKRYSDDGLQRVVIIKDDVRNDVKAMGAEVKKAFTEAAARYPKGSVQKIEMETLAATVPAMFDGVVSTDGQSFASPTAFWKKLGMLGEDVTGIREMLNQIRKGNFNFKNINTVVQAFKPFVTAKVVKPLDGNFGDELVPIQIKNSEAMILLHGAIMEGLEVDNNNPVSVLFEVMEASAYGDGVTNLKHLFNGESQDEHSDATYNGRGIDTIVFESAVKNGLYKPLDLNGKDREGMLEELSAILDEDDYSNVYVKAYPITKWGKQQNNPPHMQDSEQPRGSQITVLSVSDIPENAILKVKGVNKDKKTFIKEYLNLLKKDYELGLEEVAKVLGIKGGVNDENWKEKLSKLLIDSLNRDGRYSKEVRNAFTLINGEFILPIGDPAIADKVYSTIFNVIKKYVNNSGMPGGPVVQVSPYAYNDSLRVLEDEKDGGYIFEAYITAPTKEIENLAVTEKGKILSPEQVIKKLNEDIKKAENDLGNAKSKTDKEKLNGKLENLKGKLERFEKALDFIAYRIPTEDKYSMFKCRIKGFLPRQCGEVVILPRDIVPLSGTDFDIDKLYCMFRYGTPKTERENVRNDIFEHMWASLSHESTKEKALNPGNFEILKKLAKDVDPNFGNIKMDITKVETQLRLHESNAAGKTFVGIAALNNVSHAISTFSPVKIEDDYKLNFRIKVGDRTVSTSEGAEFSVLGNVYSPFDGSRISRTLGMFVGASADNAKEAVLQSLNITPITANIAMTMLRYGVPLKTVVYMLNLPKVKKISEKAEMEGERFEKLLQEAKSVVQPENHYISNEKLLDIINAPKTKETKGKNEKTEEAITESVVINILQQFIPISKDLSAFNQIASLGSAKNAVGPTIYNVIKKIAYIDYANSVITEGKVLNFGNIFERAPHLKPLADCYTEIVPNYCAEFSPLFTYDFKKLIDGLVKLGGIDALSDKNIKKLLDIYLIFHNKLGQSTTDEEGNLQQPEIDIFKKSMEEGGLISKVREGRNPDNESYNPFLEKLVINKNITKKVTNKPNIVFKNSGKSRELKDDLAASWTELAQSNPQLSNELLEYMFTRFGFSWMPNSAIGIAPNKVKLSYGYNSLFNDILVVDNNLDDMQLSTLLLEYIKNFSPYGVVKSVDDEKTIVQGFFKYKNKLYFSEDGKSKEQLNRLGIPNQFIEVNLEDHEHSVINSNNVTINKSKKEINSREKELDSTPEETKKGRVNNSKTVKDIIDAIFESKSEEIKALVNKSVGDTIEKENLCKKK